jgi:hypothetical protein
MSTFLDEYKALDTVPQQKEQSYRFLTANRDKLNLTPEEEYKFNWGNEAVSEDWINQKAKDIQAQIEGASSTAILRRGLGKEETTDKVDAPVAAATKAAGVSGGDGNGGGNYGGYNGSPGSSPASESKYGYTGTLGFDSDAAKTGTAFGSIAGPAAGKLAGLVSGLVKGYTSAATQDGWMDAAISAADDAGAMTDATKTDADALGELGAMADADAAQAAADAGASYGDYGGSGHDQSGDGESGGGRSGDSSHGSDD